MIGWSISPIFAWYDLWIGAYWDRKTRRLFILPIPCFGVAIQFPVRQQAMTPDERAYAYLNLYTRRTHVELPRDLAKIMEAKGWVKWAPPSFGSSRIYSITEAGKKVLADARIIEAKAAESARRAERYD